MKHQLRASLLVKIIAAGLVVAIADVLFWQRGEYNAAFGVFALAALGAMVAARPAIRRNRGSIIAVVLAAAYALSLIWNPKLLGVVMFVIAATTAAILPRMAGFGDGWRWLQRGLVAGVVAPFRPLGDFTRLSRSRQRSAQGRTNARSVLALVAMPLNLSIVFLALFAQANPLIEKGVDSLLDLDLDPDWQGRLILWAVVAIFMGLLLRPKTVARVRPLPEFAGATSRLFPPASVRLSLIAFNALFAVQNAMDLAYLWGWARLPDGMTLAEYAHRGAYPLIVTALLAGLFVLMALSPRSAVSHGRTVRRLVVLWVAQNVLLVASSVLRTLDYVDAYSLTVLRIAALLWMALVGLGLMLVCWRLLTGKSAAWLVNANLLAVGTVLTGACFVDLGAVAARWNVAHAREIDGDGAWLDVCYLDELEDSALPSIVALERRALPTGLAARLKTVREQGTMRLQHAIEGRGWFALGDLRLSDLRKDAKRDDRDLPAVNCEGYDFTGLYNSRQPEPPLTPEPAR